MSLWRWLLNWPHRKFHLFCDRCHQEIQDAQPPDPAGGGMTAGYYVLRGWWSRFAWGSDELYLCDACMWIDPAYIAIYGHVQITTKEAR